MRPDMLIPGRAAAIGVAGGEEAERGEAEAGAGAIGTGITLPDCPVGREAEVRRLTMARLNP